MKCLFTLASTVILLIFCPATKAQPMLEWATVVGDAVGAFPGTVAADGAENVYLSGYFSGQQDFDPGPGKYVLSAPAGTNFLLKLDGNKNFLWVDTFSYYVETIRFDDADNMYVLGYGTNYFVVVKRDASYNQVWSSRIDGSSNPVGYDIRIDKAGNVYVGGRYSSFVDFDPGPAQALFESSATAGFVLKLDAQGQFKWASDFQSTTSHVRAVQPDDSGNVYFSGMFLDSVDFDPGVGKVIARRGDLSYGGFVGKLDSNGSYTWAKVFSSSEAVSVTDLCMDKKGDLLIAGSYTGSLDCDPGPGTYTLQPMGIDEACYFVAKLTGNGSFVWARQQGSSGQKIPYMDPEFGIDSAGNAYMAGLLGDTSVMNTTTPAVSLIPIGGTDVFVSRINADGSFGWAKSFGSKHRETTDGMQIDNMGNVYVTGRFFDTIDFDPGPAIYNLYGIPWYPSTISTPFLLKLNQCTRPVLNDFVFDCDSFSFGGTTYKSSGIYQKRFPAFGCDSIVILELEINADIKIAKEGNTLTARTRFGNCQWLDCDNGMSPIAGATGKTYTPVKTGRYAVQVTLAGCADTSSCYDVIGTKAGDVFFSDLKHYPNPTNGRVTIDIGGRCSEVRATITDITGRVVGTHIAKHSNIISLQIDGPKGLYFIRLHEEAGLEKVLKITKE